MSTTLALSADVLAEVLDRASARTAIATRDNREVTIDHKGDGVIRATLWTDDDEGREVQLDCRTFCLVEVEDAETISLADAIAKVRATEGGR